MENPKNIYYVEDRFVPADQAVIPVDDLAILRGYGVFDLIRTYRGKALFLTAHIDRLLQSAEKVGLNALPWSRNELIRIVIDTLRKNPHHQESNVRIVITGGSSTDFMTPQGRPRLLVLATPRPLLPESWYIVGVKIITVQTGRRITGAKSIDYLPATIALQTAKEKGAVEALYIDRDGWVSECTTSNLFAFIGSKLVTPGSGILSGITRGVILELARDCFPVDIRNPSLDELLTAQEIFITGTNKGLVPVVQVDDTVIGNGRPGERTRRLMEMLASHTERLASEN
ncbi:MAG: aminotransferase class IV [Desulfobacterales bacterium]